MGQDLRGGLGNFHVTKGTWDDLLELGQRFGWEPAGTQPPPDWQEEANWEWGGDYRSNSYQRVTADDARAWAKALEYAAAQLGNADSRIVGERNFIGDTDEDKPGTLADFIRYCKAGGFTIV